MISFMFYFYIRLDARNQASIVLYGLWQLIMPHIYIYTIIISQMRLVLLQTIYSRELILLVTSNKISMYEVVWSTFQIIILNKHIFRWQPKRRGVYVGARDVHSHDAPLSINSTTESIFPHYQFFCDTHMLYYQFCQIKRCIPFGISYVLNQHIKWKLILMMQNS